MALTGFEARPRTGGSQAESPHRRATPLVVTATAATAVASGTAAAALRLPWAWFAAILPGLFLATGRPRRVPRADRQVSDLMAVTAVAAFVLVLLHPTPDDFPTIARFALVAVVPLSLLWPSPVVVRYCLLLAAGCLAAAGGSLGERAPSAALLAVSAAVALVGLNRLATPTAVRRKRVAGEAAVLLLVAGLVGLLVAVLLPPPDANGGGGGFGGRFGRQGRPDPRPQYLFPLSELDAGGYGTGTGNEIVFRVKADHSALWRTMTFDDYDGRRWRRSDELDEPAGSAVIVGDLHLPLAIGDIPGTTGRALDQHVKIETDYIGVLPAALRPVSVQVDEAATMRDGTLQAFLAKGDAYDVVSQVPPDDADVLRGHDVHTGPVPPDVSAFYLPFRGLPSRVAALAGEITAGATTGFEQVQAVEGWMRANTVVKSGTPALPRGADPIDQYLFVDRAGSSQQAASATVMLLRILGIPARLAVGYLPGAQSAVTGEYVVRARDSHTWVEAWFPGVGWVEVDPSGRFVAPAPAGDSLLDRLRRLWWVAAVLVLAAVAFLAWRLLARRRRRRARPWATQTYERLTRAGSRHGRPRFASETPAEYCGMLAVRVEDPRLVAVGRVVTTAAWSGRDPPAPDRTFADEVVEATRRSANLRSRLRRARAARAVRREARRVGRGRSGSAGQNTPAG